MEARLPLRRSGDLCSPSGRVRHRRMPGQGQHADLLVGLAIAVNGRFADTALPQLTAPETWLPLPHKIHELRFSNDLKKMVNFYETFSHTVVTRFQIGDRFWKALEILYFRVSFRPKRACSL